tara:strand:- start:4286 stop:5350 length:1065 start_codon:yes stop_codon:yes gene_type:complete
MLLTKPIPDLNETFQSYVIRLARFNHYKFEHWSLYLSQESVSYRGRTKSDRDQLSNFVHQSTGMDDVLQLFDQWMFFEEGKLYFDYKAIKICPACFAANKNKLLAKWSFRNYVVCSEHSCLLVDSCTNCGELITERCIHSLRCSKCDFSLEDLSNKKIESDYFSKRINELIDNGLLEERDVLIDELSWQHRQIRAMSFLVYQDDSKFWRSKRNYSIEQKHEHQSAIGKLLENPELLLQTLSAYLESKFEQGETDLGTALIKFNRYLANESCPQLIFAAKKLINSFPFDESQTAGIIWLSNLYNIEKSTFKNFVQLNFECLLFKNRVISASHAAKVIDAYFTLEQLGALGVNTIN